MNSDNLQKIRQARANARAKTAKALERKEAKRARKGARAKPAESAYATEKKHLKIVDSTDVCDWFCERIVDSYGRAVIIAPWTVPQMALAKKMLAIYGSDLVKRGVDWVFDNWAEIQKNSRGRHDGGVPTINLLWGYRDTVFMALQAPKKVRDLTLDPKNSDEYREKPGRPRIGW